MERIPLEEIRAAAGRLSGVALRTPLARLEAPEAPGIEIWLKLETLQPIGSFKIRGAGNAMLTAPRESLSAGVYTASAGNMAQGLAWNARRLGVACTAIVPEHAPQTKLAAIERLGASAVKVPFDRWWRVLVEHEFRGAAGRFVHPVSDPAVIAGNATIGLELLEDLPDVDTVLVPFGGGGLSCGIASAVKALRPSARVLACEVATAAPFAASLSSGRAEKTDYRPSFVDGIGSGGVLSEMWPLASALLDGSVVVSVEEAAEAVRFLATRARVVAEGAGAVPVAAALSGRAGGGRIACIVSGGNIDAAVLAKILAERAP